jgi:hypothetical protein
MDEECEREWEIRIRGTYYGKSGQLAGMARQMRRHIDTAMRVNLTEMTVNGERVERYVGTDSGGSK